MEAVFSCGEKSIAGCSGRLIRGVQMRKSVLPEEWCLAVGKCAAEKGLVKSCIVGEIDLRAKTNMKSMVNLSHWWNFWEFLVLL